MSPADHARVQRRLLPTPEAAAGSRYVDPSDPCPCGAPTDALGTCLGTCTEEAR